MPNNSSSLYHIRETCRLCHSRNLRNAIPLAPLPMISPNTGKADLTGATAPADVMQCRQCGFLQIAAIVDPEVQYRDYKYETGISVGLREHFGRFIAELGQAGDIGPGSNVLEIGSNDGSVLTFAKEDGAQVLGIDPAERIASKASAGGIPTIGDFFTADLARKIVEDHGQFDVILCNNAMANIDDLDDVFEGIRSAMAPEGRLSIETQYAVDMINKTLLDVVYHEHLSYFAVSPMKAFCSRMGLHLFDAERIAPKGGSIRFHIQQAGGIRPESKRMHALLDEEQGADGIMDVASTQRFNDRIAAIGEDVRLRLRKSREESGRALVFGSSVGCAALIYFFELGKLIDGVFDDTPLQNVLRGPDGLIPVFSGSQLVNEPATDIAVLAWRYADRIVNGKKTYCERGGRFYRVLPQVEFV